MEVLGKITGVREKDGKTLIGLLLESNVGLDDLNANDLMDISIEKHREKRSKSANAYLWTLLIKMSEAVGDTPISLYKQMIREAGVKNSYAVIPEAVADTIRALTSQKAGGTGDFAEMAIGDSKAPDGYKTVIHYVGSSKYNTKQMSMLIDWVVEGAKSLGIETLTPEEVERLKDG